MILHKKIIHALLCGLFALAGVEIHGARKKHQASYAQKYGESLGSGRGRRLNEDTSSESSSDEETSKGREPSVSSSDDNDSEVAELISDSNASDQQRQLIVRDITEKAMDSRQNESPRFLRVVGFAGGVLFRMKMDFMCDWLDYTYPTSRLGQQIDNLVREYATYNVRSDVNTNDNKFYRFIKDTGNVAAPLVDQAAPHVATAIKMGARAGIRAAVLTFTNKHKGSSFKRLAVVELCGDLAKKALPIIDQRLEGCTFRGSQQLRIGLAWLSDTKNRGAALLWNCAKEAAITVLSAQDA